MTTLPEGLLPFFTSGEVVKGFGRGSKSLGIPTANFPPEVVEKFSAEAPLGVYYGFASLERGKVYKMAMNVGWNPFYKNEKKSMETWILHQFDEDFYGKILRVAILGYIRPEMNFDSVEGLIARIQEDGRIAEEKLEERQYSKYKDDQFFQSWQ